MPNEHFLIVAFNLILQNVQLLIKLLSGFLILLLLLLNTFLQPFHLLQTCPVYQLVELVLLTQFSQQLGLAIRGHVDLPLLFHELVPRVAGWCAFWGLYSSLKQFWITLFVANFFVFLQLSRAYSFQNFWLLAQSLFSLISIRSLVRRPEFTPHFICLLIQIILSCTQPNLSSHHLILTRKHTIFALFGLF